MKMRAQVVIVIATCVIGGILVEGERPGGPNYRCGNGRCLPPCVYGKFSVDLNTTNDPVVTPSLEAMGITILDGPELSGDPNYLSADCSKTILLKVNFERLTEAESAANRCGCGSYCGRKMLKIVMTLSHTPRRGHIFNVGDSITNNGFGGDGATQSNDAELHGTHDWVTQWGNDLCGSDLKKLDTFDAAVSSDATKVTVWISNEYVRIQNDVGFDQRLCHRCLWALNGQPDSEGPTNEDIFIGFNRLIQARVSDWHGFGVCNVDISWHCPDCLGWNPRRPFDKP